MWSFPKKNHSNSIALLCSKVASTALTFINPTLTYQVGDIKQIPFYLLGNDEIKLVDEIVNEIIKLTKIDWDNYENSWNFHASPLITNHYSLATIYSKWLEQNIQTIQKVKELEEKNNSIFIDAYCLQDELTPEVPIEQITLTINPKYRYGIKLTDQELVARFQSDTIAELISYSIGCMMGRYRIDKPGLIYAHSGNKDFDKIYNSALSSSTNHCPLSTVHYPPDDDGIIPLTDLEWFDDDATYRFKEFLIAVWGEETLQENLQFVAGSLTLHALKPKKGESSLETIRRYFSTGFFKQHLKTYKKRPIYWLFSSGKQKAFEALVYLHRYNESTLARMRTEYVTPLMGKYEARVDSLQQLDTASGTDARRIEKELKALNNKQTELRTFDDKLKHYADMRISIDLDDGVKVNYGKFGDLLAEVKAVTGQKSILND